MILGLSYAHKKNITTVFPCLDELPRALTISIRRPGGNASSSIAPPSQGRMVLPVSGGKLEGNFHLEDERDFLSVLG